MTIAFTAILAVVVGAVIWFAFHHAAPTSQIVKPPFSSPAVGSKPVSGDTGASLGDYIVSEQAKGSYGV